MISVVIPAYKNTEMLVKNLKTNRKFLNGATVIVINDDPSSSIQTDLKGLDITLIENIRNLGFAGAVNVGVKSASDEFILLLNTDVVLTDDSWKKAYDKLKHTEEYFAVSFAQIESDGSIVGKNVIYWENGFFLHSKAADMHAGPTGWAEGGSCMFRKLYFEKLGGLDTLYSPFYWEDIDLSYRAWKAGYRIAFDPRILVEHHHESTIGKYFKKKQVERIAYRNQFIFIWKNIGWRLVVHHLLRLPIFLILTAVNPSVSHGFLSALIRLPAIMHKRNEASRFITRTDREILDQFRT